MSSHKGGLALRPTVFGRPRMNNANADSAIAIIMAIKLTERILAVPSLTLLRTMRSITDAAITPATKPNKSVLTAPERS